MARRGFGGGGQFGSLREAYIPNHSLLLCLEALEKFLVVGGVGWSRPVLGFSLSQAEQNWLDTRQNDVFAKLSSNFNLVESGFSLIPT